MTQHDQQHAVQVHARASDDPVSSYLLTDDGTFPNNAALPVVIYREAIALDDEDAAAIIEDRFHEQRWGGVWRNGIFSYHHYHSTAHEVLCVATGTVRAQLGGETGPVFDLEPGDVVVIPAGVAHKNLGASDDLVVVGAYPPHQIWDINTGDEDERPRADENIAAVPLPEIDPVLGPDGPIMALWGIQR
ncbi:MAG: cupin domain-containing protein [Chloroflexota bacterium]|nr:cupin domain-containing protein [Chloroflexota bacterium]